VRRAKRILLRTLAGWGALARSARPLAERFAVGIEASGLPGGPLGYELGDDGSATLRYANARDWEEAGWRLAR